MIGEWARIEPPVSHMVDEYFALRLCYWLLVHKSFSLFLTGNIPLLLLSIIPYKDGALKELTLLHFQNGLTFNCSWVPIKYLNYLRRAMSVPKRNHWSHGKGITFSNANGNFNFSLLAPTLGIEPGHACIIYKDSALGQGRDHNRLKMAWNKPKNAMPMR